MERYKMFMQSFKRVYPEIYDRYKGGISKPVAGVPRAAINSNIQISAESGFIATHIIAGYYIALAN